VVQHPPKNIFPASALAAVASVGIPQVIGTTFGASHVGHRRGLRGL
jgi:hypothetical protein